MMFRFAGKPHAQQMPASMQKDKRQALLPLALGAIGVVYGDIGTSPLYTIKEVFGETGKVPLDRVHLLGTASVIFWSLMIVVTLKYVTLILRADNRGEGGIMALTALASQAVGAKVRSHTSLLLLGLAGAALFYGDSVITPAISVLSAIEGLEIATPALKPFVLPISVGVLLGLFMIQRHGTGTVGKLFGPVMLAWFGTLAATGLLHITQEPHVLQALNPWHAIVFVQERGWGLFAAVGAIVLALTGAEALYADMGHFGKAPIRVAWLGLVLPALTLNYFGQCAMLMVDPTGIQNPFFRMFPRLLLIPAIVLAAVATVIASQAVISGAYSMTKQAVLLGFLPRLRVLYTSAHEIGQIYVPQVNWVLLVAVVAACLGFGNSSALASAYGIAVTMTMLITTVLTFFVVRYAWRLPLWLAVGATGVFAAFDATLVLSCSMKFLEGGWFPLTMGTGIFIVMATWKRGRELLMEAISTNDPDLVPFISALADEPGFPRTPRTAVYVVASAQTVPQALMHNLKHNAVLHEQNVILTVVFHEVPWIPFERAVQVKCLVKGFWQVCINYGFMDTPDVPKALASCAAEGLPVDPMTTSYFLSREVVVPTPGPGMADWRERLFATMTRNASNIGEFFGLPNNSVIELGTRVPI